MSKEEVWYGINVADTLKPGFDIVLSILLPPIYKGHLITRGKNIDDDYLFYKLPLEQAKTIDFILKQRGIRTQTLRRRPKPMRRWQVMPILVCPACNTEVEVEFLSDVVECPNCGMTVSKENAGKVLW